MTARRSVRELTDLLDMAKAFTPESDEIPALEAELAAAKARGRMLAELRAGKLTHVQLPDGWAEVVRVERGYVFVQVGENSRERVAVRDVIDGRKL